MNYTIKLIFTFFLLGFKILSAQAFEGYTLFSPTGGGPGGGSNNNSTSYLVDINEQIVNSWNHTN